MTRTVMIDLPTVTNSNWKISVDKYLEIVEALTPVKGVQYLLTEDMAFNFVDYDDMTYFLKIMSQCSTTPYDLANLDHAAYTTSTPILTSDTFPQALNDEITVQAHTLHLSVNTLFVVSNARRGGQNNNLKTKRDRKEREHETLSADNIQAIKDFVASTYPKLKQLKHGAVPYSVGGVPVSAFSSYNPRDEEPAKRLIREAFLNYNGEEQFPQYLYAWDSDKRTYVEFRLSTTDGTYHGLDCNKEKVPDYIRKHYNR